MNILLNQKIDQELLEKRKERIQSFKAKMDSKRNWPEKLADFLTESFGTVTFLILNIVFFFIWIFLNNDISGITTFDPFPYGLLTMIVSLEAIFLSIIVLMSQNQAEQINNLRDEIELQINMQAEQEITKTLKMVHKIYDHLGIENEQDEELKRMEENTNIEEIEIALLEEREMR